MVLNFNRLAKFASAIFFIALFDQSQLASVLKFIFWYFCHFGEFMKYTYFILTFVISDLLSKNKPYQVYFNNRENKFERVTFNAINAHNAAIITINFVTSPWTGNKVDSYGLVIKLIVIIAALRALIALNITRSNSLSLLLK